MVLEKFLNTNRKYSLHSNLFSSFKSINKKSCFRFFSAQLLLVFIAITAISCSSQKKIEHGDMQLLINNDMQFKITSKKGLDLAIYDEFVSSEYLVTREFTASKFNLDEYKTSNNDDGDVYELVGSYSDNGFDIQKRIKITAMKEFPDMLHFNVEYINVGNKSTTVTSWVNGNFRLNNNDKNKPIWSLQTSSSIQRDDWVLPVEPGFYQKNYMGMNNSDYGGGMPIVDLWRNDVGIMVGVTEMTPKLFSTPVEMNHGSEYASLGIQKDFDLGLEFNPQDTITTYETFVSLHEGDFFHPLKQFSHFMQSKGLVFVDPEPSAYEPVWCAWGYERTFTIDEIVATLPKVKELGFKWVDVDDGFQISEGDWEPNERFPGGDKDMRRLADEIHKFDLKAKLWWAPLAADPDSRILREKPEMQLKTVNGIPQYITWWDSYYLSPVNPHTKEYTRDLVKRFLHTWDFDGLKMDGQHLNCCAPDYNPHSALDYPEQAVEDLPGFFEDIYQTAVKYKPNAVIQNCPCGTAMNFFNMPYMNQAVSSDPLSSWQIRLKGKVYRAIFDEIAYYADHVELSDNGDDFPTQIGVGAVVGSKFTWPRDNPDVKKSYLLTDEKEQFYKKWVGIYNDKMLSKGVYRGDLYDLTFDKPETHLIEKDDKFYYSFYADEWSGDKIELKGLKKDVKYIVNEYTNDVKVTYELDGGEPIISPTFSQYYLIEVSEK